MAGRVLADEQEKTLCVTVYSFLIAVYVQAAPYKVIWTFIWD